MRRSPHCGRGPGHTLDRGEADGAPIVWQGGGVDTRSERLLGGRYQLRSVLGRGGMAAVWAGTDLRLDRPVAVKVLDGAALADPDMVRRLDHEAKTLARLAHPNIVAGYDVGTEDGVPYLVMEFVDGENLARRLESGPLDVATAIAVTIQICDALEAAHRSGVVHRDIKPENVLLTTTGTAKVCDFGIARLLNSSRAGLTGPATAVGTSEYMAPEQATAGEVDARTDLYAVGCVLYHMLTGRPPLTGDDPLRVLWRHVHEAPTPPAQLRPGLPADLDALVTQLLAKDPADRPSTAAEVRDHLVHIEAGASHPGAATSADGTTGAAATSVMARASVPTRTVVTRAATTQTRTMPAADRGGPFRLGPLGIAGVAVGAALVAALAVSLTLSGRSQPPGTPDQGGGPSVTVTATSASPGPEAGTVDAVRAAVAAQVTAGQLDRRSADELARELDALERNIDRGDTDRAADRISELRRELDDLHDDGKLTDAGRAAILTTLNELAATLPADEDD